MAAYTVKYFGLPALAEPIRLLLHLGKYDWVDEKLTFKEWPEVKKSTKWGQVPVVITADGQEMTQTKALVRYFGKQVSWGRKHLIFSKKLYPTDAKLAFQVDEMIDAMEDVRMKITPTFKIKDQAEKEAARKALFAEGGECTELLKKIEMYCGDKFVAGNTLTIADIWFFFFLNLLRSGFFDGLPKDFLDKYPKMKAIVANVGSIPEVKAYYAKKDLSKEPLYSPFVE